MEYDHKELQAEINAFAENTDFDELYTTVSGMRTQFAVERGSELIRKTADDAAGDFAAAGDTLALSTSTAITTRRTSLMTSTTICRFWIVGTAIWFLMTSHGPRSSLPPTRWAVS